MYSGIEDPRQWVFPLVLEEQARTRPDQLLIAMIDGGALSYRELRDQAEKVASLLQALGVSAGDHLAIMLPNGLDLLRAWAGTCRLGAVAVMINAELTGDFLSHPLRDAKPSILIVHEDFLAVFQAISAEAESIVHTLVVGDGEFSDSDCQRFDQWRDFEIVERPFPSAQTPACLMYTSGTTGPPKGVVMPHAHCFLFGLGVVENLGVTPRDRYYTVLPLSHANGLLMQIGAVMIAGAQATLRGRFSATAWLDDVRRSGATITHSLGVISAFVQATPRTSDDQNHQLRLIFSAPNTAEHDRIWRERFGITEVLSGYGMTETNIPLYVERNVTRPGSCGRPYAARFEVEVRNSETDLPVGRGEVGEIMVRPRIANGFMAGYFGLPAKTVEAWRNLWFHTGDAARVDEDGYFIFVDRMKDCIRRRGENISASDIEASFSALPGVAEVAAFGVSSDIEGGEDEIMLAIVPSTNEAISTKSIIAHGRAHLPSFARPRYVDFRSGLPKTNTEKVRKVELKQDGVTASAIDLAPFYR